MAVFDAVVAALLVTLSATLAVLAFRAYRRQLGRQFAILGAAFLVVVSEAVLISLAAVDVAPAGTVSLTLVAGLQVGALLLIYAASFRRR